MCKQEVEDKFHFTTSCSYTSDEKEALFDHMKSDFFEVLLQLINLLLVLLLLYING